MGLAPRRMTLSTAGWVPGIRRMAEEKLRVKLAVSLHSALGETRSRLMPAASRYGLAELANAIADYYRSTRMRVTYEVIFFDGINDADRDVEQLVRFARRTPSKINVIPFHPITGASPGARSLWLRPSPRMHQIVDRLRSMGLIVMVRSSAGVDIDAACGQLAVHSSVKPHRARAQQLPTTLKGKAPT